MYITFEHGALDEEKAQGVAVEGNSISIDMWILMSSGKRHGLCWQIVGNFPDCD